MANLVIDGTTYSGVNNIRLKDTSNNYHTYTEWYWMGAGAELLQTVYNGTAVALEDTLFNGWTPSTTAKSIVSSATAGTFTADMTTYDYLVRWTFDFNNAFQSGATLQVTPIRQYVHLYQGIFRRPSNNSNLTSGTMNGNATATLYTAPICKYYNSSGSVAVGYTGSYGIYPSATAMTFSSSTAASPTVTVKTPAIYARCSTTYMATARAAEIDQANAKYTLKGEIFRMPCGGTLRSMYNELVSGYNGT